MSIEGGNKIIAEFMELKPNPYDNGRTYGVNAFLHENGRDWLADDWIAVKYHTSWDWLMPVVAKFEEVNDCFFDWDKSAYDENAKLSIKCVWETMVEAIHQFNSTKAEQ